MRALMVIGVLLIAFGIFVLAFQGVTYVTQDRIVDAGPLKVDVQHPHTIVFNPIVGVVAVVAGIALAVAGSLVRAT